MPLEMFRENDDPRAFPGVRHVIAVAAGKGGVGKSSVSVNLALALKQRGYRVGVLDTDIYGPSVRQMLPEDRLPGRSEQKLIPAVCSGIRVMSMAYFRGEGEAAVVRAPIANRVVSQFMREVDWGDLDVLLIDFPPGTGDIQLTLSQQAPLTGALMVTTPQKVAVLDVKKAMDMFHQVKVPILGVVENMAYYEDEASGERRYLFGQAGGEALAAETGVPFLGSLPLDPTLCRCADQGESLFRTAPESTIAQEFLRLADTVVKHLVALQEKSEEILENFELIWK